MIRLFRAPPAEALLSSPAILGIQRGAIPAP